MLEVFTKFKYMVDKQSGRKLKTPRTDGGGECVSNDFAILCVKEGIMHKVVSSYTPQQNGTAERKHRIIMNMARSMLKGKHLPNKLWGDAMSTATYIFNKCLTKNLEGITQKECSPGVNPNLSHLKVFGSITHKHVPDQLRRKLDDKSR